MKELKFRIWDNSHNEFIRPDYGLIGFCYPLDGRIAVLTSNGDPIEDCVIEQYTGLKDKNGKEIFEGDLVAYEKNNIASVRFEYGGFYPFVEPYNDFGCPSGKEVEVIGNIHESNMKEES